MKIPWRLMASVLALLGAFVLGLVAAFPPTHTWVLGAGDIRHEVGLAYTAPVHYRGPLFRLLSDGPAHPSDSQLTVVEDAADLGPAHALHDAIRTRGSGSFSHWGQTLFFSSSDGTDPRANGRTYRMHAPLSLHLHWRAVALALAALWIALNLGWLRQLSRRAALRFRAFAYRPARLSIHVFSRRNLVLLAALCGLGSAAVLFAAVSAPTVVMRIERDHVVSGGGLSYAVPIETPRSYWYELRSDDMTNPQAARLTLFENGTTIGPSHASHENIRTLGGGRYSLWQGTLHFSSSDNRDPRELDRTYEAIATLGLKSYVAGFGWLLLGAACVAGFAALETTRRQRFEAFVLSAAGVGKPASDHTHRWPPIAGMCGGAVIGAVLVLAGWHGGAATMSGSEVARYFPVSDAGGYYGCAASTLAAGNLSDFHPAWCSRRILYPAFLSSLLSVTASSTIAVLLLQGAVVGVAIAALTVQLSRFWGALGALVVALGLSVFAWEYALGLFMTEVLGLGLGLCALVLLLACSVRDRVPLLFVACAALSMALTARAGALFMMPAVLAWLAWRVRSATTDRAALLTVAVLGLAVGPLLQVGVVNLLGYSAANTGGNFAPTLYGLSTGSRKWSDAYKDFASILNSGDSPEAFAVVYHAAWQNVLQRPEVLLKSLLEATSDYCQALFDFILVPNARVAFLVLLVVGLVTSAVRLRSQARGWPGLLAALSVGELLSAPWIVDSGGTRVFAASIGVRFCFVAVGAMSIAQLVFLISRRASKMPTSEPRGSGVASGTAAAFVATAALLILLPSAGGALLKAEPIQRSGCSSSELVEVVTRVGRSPSLRVLEGGPHLVSFTPFAVGKQRFTADKRLDASELGPQIRALPAPLTLVRAVDVALGTKQRIIGLAYRGALASGEGPMSVCYSPADFLELADVKYYFIRTIKPVER